MRYFLIILLFAPFWSHTQNGFTSLFDSIVIKTINSGESILIQDVRDTTFRLSFHKPKNGDLNSLKTLKVSDMYFGYEHGDWIDSNFYFQDSILKCSFGHVNSCYSLYYIEAIDTLKLDSLQSYLKINQEENKIIHVYYFRGRWHQFCEKFDYKQNRPIGHYGTECSEIDTIDIESLNDFKRLSLHYEKSLWLKKEKIAMVSNADDTQYEVLYFNRNDKIKKIELLLFYDEGSPHIQSLKQLNRSKKGANYHYRYRIKYKSTEQQENAHLHL